MNFNSHELQQAFEKAKTVIESIPQTQDTISNEIKFIENFLKTNSVSDSFSL